MSTRRCCSASGATTRRWSAVTARPPALRTAGARTFSLADDRPTLDELCRRYTHLVLAEASGNKSRAAEVLGINRRTLYRYLEADADAAPAED